MVSFYHNSEKLTSHEYKRKLVEIETFITKHHGRSFDKIMAMYYELGAMLLQFGLYFKVASLCFRDPRFVADSFYSKPESAKFKAHPTSTEYFNVVVSEVCSKSVSGTVKKVGALDLSSDEEQDYEDVQPTRKKVKGSLLDEEDSPGGEGETYDTPTKCKKKRN